MAGTLSSEIVLAEDGAARLDEGHECVKCAPAQLDRPAVGQQLALEADDLEPAVFDGCLTFGQPGHGHPIVHGRPSGLSLRTFQNESVFSKDSRGASLEARPHLSVAAIRSLRAQARSSGRSMSSQGATTA